MQNKAIIVATLALGLTVVHAPDSAAQSEGFARHMEDMATRIGKAIEHLGDVISGSPRVQQGHLTEKFSRTIPLSRNGSFELHNVSGDIVVTGGTAAQVQIEAIKRGRTQQSLQSTQIEVNQSADRVEVRVEYPRESREGAGVDFSVIVPKGASVLVHSISGDIKVTSIDGELRADTVSGEVTITDAGRLAGAKSVSGTVTVQSASTPDNLSASSVSGDVKLHSVKARSIEAQAISGSVEIIHVSCERAVVRSTSGDISFTGPISRGGRYELISHSGDILFNLSDKVGFELTASSFSGDIKSELPLTMRAGGGDRGRPMRRQEVNGTFGDGSAAVILRSFSGDIRITRQ